MVSMLEQVIVDATALKEAAIKNAENIILEKYAIELKEAVDSILEQDEPDLGGMENDPMGGLGALPGMPPTEDPLAQKLPMAATDGEKACPCPENDQEIEINFDQLTQQMNGGDNLEQNNELPGQMGELKPEEDATMMEEDTSGIQVPAQLGPELHMYHMNMGDAVYKVGSLASAGKPVPPDLLDSAISSLESLKGRIQEPEEQQELEGLVSQLQQLQGTQNAGTPEGEPQPTREGDYNQTLFEDDEELTEEFLDSVLETLEVEMNVVPHGHIGHANSAERVDAGQVELARTQDTKVAEEMKTLKKAFDKLQESQKKLEKENKTLKLDYNKVREIALDSNKKQKEINLENAKLVYENRALKSDSLNERQKSIIVEAISKVGSVDEAKIVFETMIKNSNGSGAKTPNTLTEALKVGKNNTITLVRPTNNVNESKNSPQKDRMLKLAGIKNNS